MKLLELHLPAQTGSKLQELLSISAFQQRLSILTIEEKLARLEDEFRRSVEYALEKHADLYQRLA